MMRAGIGYLLAWIGRDENGEQSEDDDGFYHGGAGLGAGFACGFIRRKGSGRRSDSAYSLGTTDGAGPSPEASSFAEAMADRTEDETAGRLPGPRGMAISSGRRALRTRFASSGSLEYPTLAVVADWM